MGRVNDGYPHHTLGWWMDERRGELGLTWKQVAEHTGVSDQHIYRIAGGTTNRMRTNTKKALERALRWASGSIDRIAGGGEPVPLAEPPPADTAHDVPELSDETRRRLAAMTWQEVKERLAEEEELHGEDAAEWLMGQIARAREDAQKG